MSDLPLRLVVAAILADLLDQADKDTRADVRTTWMVGDRKGAALAGRPAGHAQLKKGATYAKVTDPAAFEAWVSSNRPDEVEQIAATRVRPAYQAALLAAAKKAGAAVTPDGEEIPGVTITTGEPTVAVSVAEDAAELLAEAWQSGELWELLGGLLPALEPAKGEGQ